VIALLVIALAVGRRGRDWGAGLESRVARPGFAVFIESNDGTHVNSNGMAEHSADQTLGFEVLLPTPTHVMLVGIEPDGRTRVLFPDDGRATRGLEAGRHALPLRIGLAERTREWFVLALYADGTVAAEAVDQALSELSRPLTYKTLWHSRMPASPHWIHLPPLDAAGRAIE
jgi:hypothetical protein